MYLRKVMTQLQRATNEGVPVKGNFVRSAMDKSRVDRRLRNAVRSCFCGFQNAEAASTEFKEEEQWQHVARTTIT